MKTLIGKLKALVRDEEGATAVEYAIMVAAIAAVVVGTVIILGGKSDSAFQAVNTAMTPLPGAS